MIRLTTTILSIFLVSCSLFDTGSKQPIMTLNNNGGYSHGGLIVKLMDDGSSLMTTYSDAVGDAKSKRGTYELENDLLLIRYRNGDVKKLQKVTYKGQEYWADPSCIAKLNEDSNEGEWLRQTTLKPSIN